MKNSVSLAQLAEMETGEVANLPPDQLAMLLEEAASERKRLKAADDKLNGALLLRYGERASALRRAKGQDTGKVRVEDGDFVVSCDAPKKVDWDQAALRGAVETIRSWGEDAAEYVATEIKVSESKFGAWPSTIRKLFEPARTVGTGRASFAIEPKKREAA